jgi:hypothetical protein
MTLMPRLAAGSTSRGGGRRPASLVIAPTALMLILTGCSMPWEESSPSPAVAIVLSPVANSAQPDPALVVEVAAPALNSLGQLVLVESDGAPDEIGTLTMPDAGEYSPSDWDQFVSNSEGSIEAAVLASASTDAESAPLEAITAASRRLDQDRPREIHYFGSGLQTAGAMPMQNGGLYLEPIDVAEHLDEVGLLPDLRNVVVHLHGLGSVSGSQSPLDLASLTQLERMWTTVLERAGATVELHPAPFGNPPSSELPIVSDVEVRPIGTLPGIDISCTRTQLDDAVLSFVSGTAEFVDERAAAVTIDDVAEQLRGCPGPFTVLAGTSSAGTPESRASVATQRVERMAAELESRGLDPAALRTIAAATDHCGFQPDRGADGRLLLEQAAANRMVVIFATTAVDVDC